jgi:predicted ribosome quality control (RQC) complex YloA/Tae2 family protein
MEKMDLDRFLERMIEIINRRMEKQEKEISDLRKEIRDFKKKGQGLDESVLNVLKGDRE